MEVLLVVSSIFGFYLAGQWQEVAVAVSFLYSHFPHLLFLQFLSLTMVFAARHFFLFFKFTDDPHPRSYTQYTR